MTRRDFLLTSAHGIGAMALAGCASRAAVSPPVAASERVGYAETIPGTTVAFDMKPIPGDADAGIAPFWLASTEVTWEPFLLWAYADAAALAGARGADGVTHPTRPYGDVYRGYGRGNQPALGMSHRAAVEFCGWLSKRTGKSYRLPSEAEWEHAYRLGGTRAEDGWHLGNSDGRPRPVATSRANALGLHDMAGNVAEWCATPVVMGGHFMAPAGEQFRMANDPDAWNAYDPQEPKSVWWLSSADFVGFRVARSG